MNQIKLTVQIERRNARKYKRLGLPVQRRAAVEHAVFFRRVLQGAK